MNTHTKERKYYHILMSEGKIARRFRNANIILFALAFMILLVAMFAVFNGIIRDVAFDFAGRYASSAANALSAHIEKEIGLLSKAAHSGAVVDWLSDETNHGKQVLAFEEMSGIVKELYSNNLYIGIEKTKQEFDIKEDYTEENLLPVDTLLRGSSTDAWYYRSISSNKDYLLSIDMDHILQKKCLWLDYKVVEEEAPLGVLCTGLDFAQLIRELFTHSASLHMRGIIINKNGFIQMDSYLINDDGLLYHDAETRFDDVFADQVLVGAVESYLNQASQLAESASEPIVVQMKSGRYHYASITPIRLTDWTVVILYDPSSFFDMARFLPAFTIVLLVLVIFALVTNSISFNYIFKPLELLVDSLVRLKENHQEHIYGIERDDEFGNLSNTIIDLFAKANYDALTGIYNRRFLENNLQQIIDFLSRSNGIISLLMVDVDHFKLFNDTYGHQEGDRCLESVAQAMAGSLTRANDFVARYGGEEFIAVLPNTDEAGIRLIADKVLESVRCLNIPHSQSSAAVYVTVSIGATTAEVHYQHEWQNYVKCADDALYESKQSGRNRYTFKKYITEL